MTPAIPWDGIGPKEECLLRIDWGGGTVGWEHFQYQDDDLDQHEGYHSDGLGMTIRKVDNYSTRGLGCVVTHYAPLPTIARVIDLTGRQRNDADEGAATV